MDFDMEKIYVPYMSPTVVISDSRWFEIMDIVANQLYSQGDKEEFKQWIALLKEAGYDTIDHLQTAVARELRNELGIPLRWGMQLLRVARAIKDACARARRRGGRPRSVYSAGTVTDARHSRGSRSSNKKAGKRVRRERRTAGGMRTACAQPHTPATPPPQRVRC